MTQWQRLLISMTRMNLLKKKTLLRKVNIPQHPLCRTQNLLRPSAALRASKRRKTDHSKIAAAEEDDVPSNDEDQSGDEEAVPAPAEEEDEEDGEPESADDAADVTAKPTAPAAAAKTTKAGVVPKESDLKEVENDDEWRATCGRSRCGLSRNQSRLWDTEKGSDIVLDFYLMRYLTICLPHICHHLSLDSWSFFVSDQLEYVVKSNIYHRASSCGKFTFTNHCFCPDLNQFWILA